MQPWLFLLLISTFHAVYLCLYPQKYTIIFCLLAVGVFAIHLLLSKWNITKSNSYALLNNVIQNKRAVSIFLLLPFAVPILFHSYNDQTVVFWKFNIFARMTIAWLVFSVIWLNLIDTGNGEQYVPLSSVPLFIVIWSSIFWMMLVWDVGGHALYSKHDDGSRLAKVIFNIWENKPFSAHYGLAFLSLDNYDKNAYSNHSQFYLLLMYAYVKLIQVIGGVTLGKATRLIPFFYSSCIISGFLFALSRLNNMQLQITKPAAQISIFLGLGIILTLPDFWITLVVYNDDNWIPLVIVCIILLYPYVVNARYTTRGFLVLLCLLSMISPLYGILATVVLIVYQLTDTKHHSRTNIKVLMPYFVALSCAFVFIIYPKIIIKMLQYTDQSSTILFRSGLDGDTTYYNNIIQAIISPYANNLIRPWSSIIPIILFVTVAYFSSVRHLSTEVRKSHLHDIFFLFSSYIITVVFFPQAVSIHPYGYDLMFLIPLIFIAIYWSFTENYQKRLVGSGAFPLVLFMVGIIIFNLTRIAQASKVL